MRKPFESEKEFKASLFKQERTHLAGPIPWGLTLPATNLPATPVAADLAQTEDVQITPAIQALADSLNKNPVKIHNWVRNNIEFLPTYGSIQGADMTLQTKRGNAFDTASLLIGLFRAANIPARYVYGTIEVPTDKAMNWVGGVTKPEAAQSLLGQGGIPNIGVIAGGTMRSIKLEHVWVEAWVDYVPSRGAVNKVGDTWVKMDASFKQYTYTQGMDIKTAVPLDANALITQAQTGATVNQTEGWVQNLNQTNIQTALTNYQNQVKTYIDTTKPNATVGDVLGTKKIIPHNYSILLGTLPYKTIATGGKFNLLPDMVRHQFQYNLYASNYDVALENPFLSFKQSLPKLAGKKITLSFAPASQADANLIASYLPKPHTDGTPVQTSEFPSSLPGYLIHLTAELRADGQIIASGGNFTMGTELASNMGLFDPASGWEYGDVNRPIVGEHIATAVDLQGVGLNQLKAVRDRLAATKAKLQAKQVASRDQITGDMLFSGLLSYFSTTRDAAQVAAAAAGIIEYRKPSFGSFFITARPAYWFGIPKQVSFPSVTMDIDRYVTLAVEKSNATDTRTQYLRIIGQQLSAYEHLIPEKLFANPQNPSGGVSAVKALAVASAQGQRIYRITAENASTLLPSLTIGADIKAEIENALASGKVVTVSQNNVSIGNWTGVGYIIEDPVIGTGAYKISGGANGGEQSVPDLIQDILLDIGSALLDFFGNVFHQLLAKFYGVFDYFQDAYDILVACPYPANVLALYAATVMTLIAYAIPVFLLTGLLAFVVGLILSIAVTIAVTYLIEMCRTITANRKPLISRMYA